MMHKRFGILIVTNHVFDADVLVTNEIQLFIYIAKSQHCYPCLIQPLFRISNPYETNLGKSTEIK